VEGIFPGVHHKTSSIYERFRKPLLCVKITRGFITSVTKSPLKLIFFVVDPNILYFISFFTIKDYHKKY